MNQKIQKIIQQINLKKFRIKNYKKTEKNFRLYRITYLENEYDLIRKIHDKINHRYAEETRKEIKKEKLYIKVI